MEITLLGQPKTVNHIWKHSCFYGHLHSYMSPDGKVLKDSYQLQARAQYHGELLDKPLAVTLTFYLGSKRKCDLDNLPKGVMDSLTGIVWTDDSLVEELHCFKRYDKDEPRVIVGISELA